MGAVELLALGAVVMPTRWMAASHRALGLGALPDGLIVQYLARSASLLYALLGAMSLYLSFDVIANRNVIAFLMKLMIAFGIAVLALDLRLGMPWWWAAVEGPIVILMGSVMLICLNRIKTE